MPAYLLNILDAFGNRVATVNGVSVSGPATGMRNLTYHPQGAILSNSGQIAFEIPMALRRNLAIAPGAQIELVSDAWGHEGTFVVTDKAETIVEEGHFAQFTCPDLMEELRWQIVPGYSAGQGESLTTTATNLLAYQTETAWSANVSTVAVMGGFLADGATVQAAIGAAAAARFAGYRLNGTNTRRLDIGAFGTVSSGLRLQRPGGAPAQAKRASLVTITAFQQEANASGVINCIAPTGPGTGDAALTLRSIWNPSGASSIVVNGATWQISGPLSFPGYDSNYHVYRRVRGNRNPTTDGDLAYQYFLYDAASVATYRQRWLPYSRTDITPLSSTPGDLAVAAQALYQATLAYLKWHNAQNTVLTLTTDGTADLRGIAGQTVHVYWSQVASGVQTVLVNGDYQVLEVSRAVNNDTGAAVDTWKLSTTGQDVVSDTSLLVGALTAISNISLVPQIYPNFIQNTSSDYIDANNPVNFVVYGSTAILERNSAKLVIEPVPIKLTGTTTTSVDHFHSVTVPTLPLTVNGWSGATCSVSQWGSATATVTSWASASGTISTWSGVTASVVNWGSTAISITSWSGVTANVVNFSGVTASASDWSAITVTMNDWSGVTAQADSNYPTKSFGNPGVNDHSNVASHGTSADPGAHTNGLPTTPGALIIATPAFIDIKGTGGVHYSSAGTSPATQYVTDVLAETTGTHTHGLVSGSTQSASYSANPSVTGYQGTATISGVGTSNGSFTLSGRSTGYVSGTLHSGVSGSAPVAISGSPSVGITGSPQIGISGSASIGITGSPVIALGGTATGTLGGTATGALGGQATGTSAATPMIVPTSSGGVHSHTILFGVGTGPSPASLTVAVDGTVVASGITAKTTVDISLYCNDQNDHTVQITSANTSGTPDNSVGGVRWTLLTDMRRTTVKIG